MLATGLDGRLADFTVALDRLPAVADFVAGVIRDAYPSLVVPFHARWRHFVAAGRDLWAERAANARWPDAAARARAECDLAVVSVLLDAGAGPAWSYADAATGIVAGRSEGLALASLRMFEAGLFSADPADPLRADASRLAAVTAADLARGLQVSELNPLVGLDGRAGLLARLGAAVAADPALARADTPRPGGIADALLAEAGGGPLPAPAILAGLLEHLGPIWPGRIVLGGIALGDTWRHPAIRRGDATDGLVPFHKLSQWLAYSLIEPLGRAGPTITDIDGLTGLAEYRNGGLFIDAGVLRLRDPAAATRPNAVDSTLVVEWRALTIALLDGLAPLVRARLGLAPAAFPLASLLEGGTWAAGRRIAREHRSDGSPPIAVASDGTVF